MKIIIDPGHGGFDPGGGSNKYFKEKDVNLLISNYQNARFKELGIDSQLVRTYDETLTPKNRIDRINTFSPTSSDILISNHINVGGDSGGEVIYSVRGNKDLPNLIANNLTSTGLKIRNVYQRKNRLGKDFYFVQRDTIPNNALIIEYGFADNELDSNRIRFNWPELAEAVVKGTAEYLNIPYSRPNIITYIVKKDDSLYTIAKRFNTTVDKIKKDNNLTSNEIYPENILYIY
ncbi:MAG: N-acetylmuramoyl-L-alanine amidase [Bacilli bacterium]|nr:N-acetylmuramoyl-L-alanine amidase [Bacilli bacterium]